MNLDKLKEAARKYEQREEWRKAIEVYLQAIREAEDAGGEGTQDPGLYNRVGDLEMKAGDTLASLRAYEQAAELYADQGFFNNAIALCGKILRVNPSRTATYLRLAQLHARKNFVGEARKNLVEYLDRMNGVGQAEEAFKALRLFADQYSANPDIRLMLVELLRASSRTEEAREQLEKLAAELDSRGDSRGAQRTRERLHTMETEGPAGSAPARSGNDLIFIDTSDAAIGGPIEVAPVEGLVSLAAEDLEPTVSGVERELGEHGAASLDAGAATGEGLSIDGSPLTALEIGWDAGFEPVEGLDVITADSGGPAGGSAEDDSLPMLDLDESLLGLESGLPGSGEIDWLVEEGAGQAALLADPPALIASTEFDDVTAPESAGPVPGPEGLVFLQLDDTLADQGVAAEPASALEESLRQAEAEGRWDEALRHSSELRRLSPDDLTRHRKQVELAFRTGRAEELVDAYLELGDALVRLEGVEHALEVYRHVLEHQPDNARARAALGRLGGVAAVPEAAPPPVAQDFVDLGALILDDQQARDTRMRVEARQPIEDEDKAFREALDEFKRGIEANLDATDYQAHYDLGIAFKEMGLLDEAIAQFQKALRSPEGRLRTSEQLGGAFFEKGQYPIAEAVLRRAVDTLGGSDDEQLGLLYWLGRALEAQGRGREALPLYERALAVDIRFLDLGDRVRRLTAEAAP